MVQLLVLVLSSPLLRLHVSALRRIQAAHIGLRDSGCVGGLLGHAVVYLGRQPRNLQLVREDVVRLLHTVPVTPELSPDKAHAPGTEYSHVERAVRQFAFKALIRLLWQVWAFRTGMIAKRWDCSDAHQKAALGYMAVELYVPGGADKEQNSPL